MQLSLCVAGREAALWDVEERHLLELGAEKKQHVQQSYDLRRRQLAFRRSQVSCAFTLHCRACAPKHCDTLFIFELPLVLDALCLQSLLTLHVSFSLNDVVLRLPV